MFSHGHGVLLEDTQIFITRDFANKWLRYKKKNVTLSTQKIHSTKYKDFRR